MSKLLIRRWFRFGFKVSRTPKVVQFYVVIIAISFGCEPDECVRRAMFTMVTGAILPICPSFMILL